MPQTLITELFLEQTRPCNTCTTLHKWYLVVVFCVCVYYYFFFKGLAVSPLSNAALFLDYDKNPFPVFFKRGLNVSLSTDDPLQFSYTRFPLIEEYSVAKARFNLSQVDLSEISANSVRQSGFEHSWKEKFLGSQYFLTGLAGNDVGERCWRNCVCVLLFKVFS